MGNCCKRESSMSWGGDDWDCFESESAKETQRCCGKTNQKANTKNDGKNLFTCETSKCHKNVMSPSTEVKIRITKKELEELLGKIDVQGLSMEQILTQLIKTHEDHQSWRPALSSIPEVN
ncbi:hypothetical protein MKW98_015625 [Papaver atlanticum]|uniref:Uncharacterized protein n=1 Tax=Papaver atlanticum TaxID=357466 RepID=A0AAD4S6Q8_9MAGN|nr:hypothetical protein MKW98_015625 [Papaver atlanticum]